MPQKTQAELEEKDAFDRSEYKIPLDSELRKMSFVEMATALHGITVGSPRYIVIDREIKKQLAQDQAQANRTNVLLGALVGGCFALAGVVLGWFFTRITTRPPSGQRQFLSADSSRKPRSKTTTGECSFGPNSRLATSKHSSQGTGQFQCKRARFIVRTAQ